MFEPEPMAAAVPRGGKPTATRRQRQTVHVYGHTKAEANSILIYFVC